MAKRKLFEVEGLIAPPPSPALARLFAVLKGQPRHPVAQRLSWHHVRQYWELHRVLYNQPDQIIELLAEYYAEAATCIPMPNEARVLASAMWGMWGDMAAIGLDVDREEEPELPARRRRVPRRVFPPEED